MKWLIENSVIEKYLWLMVWFFLPLSIRFSSIALVLLSLIIIIKYIINPIALDRKQLLKTSLFLLLFIVFSISLLTNFIDLNSFWGELQKKLSLVFIPIMYLLSKLPSAEIRKYSIRGLLMSMLLSGLLLLIKFLYLLPSGNLESLVYHNFTEPLALGAIYYSLFLFAIIFMLLDERIEPVLKTKRIFLIPFFFLLMMLSASKLFILATVPFLIWRVYFISKFDKKKKLLLIISTVFIFLLILYPISKRFLELKNSNMDIVKQGMYTNVTPFNGLTLRLVQWKFALEILDENNAWLLGTGVDEKQELLNNKYISTGMYTGNIDSEDSGYLGYNFHNQYIETLVGVGGFGLFVLIFIIYYSFRGNQLYTLPLYYIIVLFFITESVLERQVGIVFFSLIFTSFINENTEHSS